ncbi:AraC family transcriptional regulator [Rhizobium sp. LCM 4573]|uniref:AraC family transcriptional regulator n=1 Tax=Rhizobium sp. LCM 4573 TaxID=1848291 RepID=UPI0008DB0CC6|nr:AraC family transcriptional regulator [Rhizobium sp. LCM 4573]OHV80444.1 AraC family transcriptional regulator [Rhizobium sp. LCM 4573]
METLKEAVRTYAAAHANADGLALTAVPGLRMMYIEAPRGDLHSIYRPLVCLVLQGAKLMMVGREQRTFSAGQSVIVSADMPVVGRIVEASRSEPYLAVAVELQLTVLGELTAQLGGVRPLRPSRSRTLFAEDTNAAVLDCALRLMRLLDRPEATPLLYDGIMRELHYWLLSGQHGEALRALADPTSYASRLGAAIAVLRQDYRSRIRVEELAAAAGMSLTAFHKHFKHMISISPGQYQKRLRLIEARRLMLEQGFTASSAAFEVGYESVSQFTREYARLFKTPPKRDVLRVRNASRSTEAVLPLPAAQSIAPWTSAAD